MKNELALKVYNMDDKENIFLAKIQSLCNIFDEIDELIEDNPSEQQKIDFEISDYLHLLQNEDLSDSSMLNISKKLKQARLKREMLHNTALLIKTFNDNKQRIIHNNTRGMFRSNIKNTMNKLHQDYNYRVLEENDIKELKKEINENVKKSRSKISKEELLEKINEGMRTKDIAEHFETTPSTICHLKQKYGIASRHYNRK